MQLKIGGYGQLKIKKQKKFYEQTNLQLNIEKSKKNLKWKPKYKISESVKLTIEWYKDVFNNKISPEDITKRQILNYMK